MINDNNDHTNDINNDNFSLNLTYQVLLSNVSEDSV